MFAMYSLLLKLFKLKNKTYLNITIFDKYFRYIEINFSLLFFDIFHTINFS